MYLVMLKVVSSESHSLGVGFSHLKMKFVALQRDEQLCSQFITDVLWGFCINSRVSLGHLCAI